MNDVISTKLINQLKSGGWVIGMIAPSFLSKISSPNNDIGLDVLRYYSNDCDSFSKELIEEILRKKLNNNSLNVIDFKFTIEPKNYFNSKDNEVINLVEKFFNSACLVKEVNFLGASHPHIWGKLILNENTLKNYKTTANSIIHEMGHQELFLLNLLDRLIVEKYDNNLVYAPYQRVKRPPIGRLHSCHALFRMLQYSYTKNKDELVQKFKQNIKNLNMYELSDFSKRLINEVYIPFSRDLCHE